jgi:four helix bundle protein
LKIYSFENLVVWKEARTLKLEIYKLTQQFPQDELFALTAQIRRAVVSVSANIAEGSGRTTINDQKQFYNISYSSCLEVLYHLITA